MESKVVVSNCGVIPSERKLTMNINIVADLSFFECLPDVIQAEILNQLCCVSWSQLDERIEKWWNSK